MAKTEAQRTCRHCGRPLTNAGRPSATGMYWCATNAACQNAKQKAYYARTRGIERGMAPTSCSHCGHPLKPRKVRIDDVPGKRWCQKAECQRARSGTQTQASDSGDLEVAMEMVAAMMRALVWGRVVCEACGRTDALHGYVHRDYDGEKCLGTGAEPIKMPVAQALWPNEFGAPECALPAEYDRLAPQESGSTTQGGPPA